MNKGIQSTLGTRITRAVFYVFGVLLCLVTFTPLILTLVNATRTSAQIRTSISLLPGDALMDNIKVIYRFGTNPVRILGNTFFVALSASLLSLYSCTMMAYSLNVYKYRLRNFFSAFLLIVLMVPSSVMIVGYYKMLINYKMTNTYWPLILPGMASVNCAYFLSQYMRGSLPMEIIDSGRIDGASELTIFHHISLPLMIPAIATQLVFTFVGSWNNYMIPSLIITQNSKLTLPVLVGLMNDNSLTDEIGAQFVVFAFAVIPMSILYTIFSKFIIAGITAGSIKG